MSDIVPFVVRLCPLSWIVARYRLDICVACIACRNEHHVLGVRQRIGGSGAFFMAARHDFAFLGVFRR